MSITNKDIKTQDERIIMTFGFLRYSINGRYGYSAVDEHPKKRPDCVTLTHITSTTKYHAYMYRNALLAGAHAMKGQVLRQKIF